MTEPNFLERELPDPTPDPAVPHDNLPWEQVAPGQPPAGPSPTRRTWRTLAQVAVAVLLAIPSALASVSAAGVHVSAKASAILIGLPAALVVVVSAAQNAWDHAQGNG